MTSKFPDVDRYSTDIGRNAAALSIPTRATTTRLKAQWLGSVDGAWGGLLREDPQDPIRVRIDSDQKERPITGTIINELPGELTNVTIIWIKNQRIRNRRYFSTGEEEKPWIAQNLSGQQLNIGSMWRLESKPIPRGGRIVLDSTKSVNLSEEIRKTYNEKYRSSNFITAQNTGSISLTDRRNFLEMLSLFHQLAPPSYLTTPNQQGDQQFLQFVRESGRELDLSAWFTRPCLIVIGQLVNSEIPIPLDLGEAYESEGLTIIRWIFPLPLVEEVAFKDVIEELKK